VLEIEDVPPEAQSRKQPSATKMAGNRFEIVAHEEKTSEETAKDTEGIVEGEVEETRENNEGPVIY